LEAGLAGSLVFGPVISGGVFEGGEFEDYDFFDCGNFQGLVACAKFGRVIQSYADKLAALVEPD
jgi:hypothetical protein